MLAMLWRTNNEQDLIFATLGPVIDRLDRVETGYWVSSSSSLRMVNAASSLGPQVSGQGLKRKHTAGRSGCPKILQRLLSSSWTQRTPAGFPAGIPGIAELIEGTIQQAPQPSRQWN